MSDPILQSFEEMVRRVVREEIANIQSLEDEVLDKEKAADLLHVSTTTLMRKVARKEIARLPGSPPRFLKSELLRRR